jgi:hypothetical protein
MDDKTQDSNCPAEPNSWGKKRKEIGPLLRITRWVVGDLAAYLERLGQPKDSRKPWGVGKLVIQSCTCLRESSREVCGLQVLGDASRCNVAAALSGDPLLSFRCVGDYLHLLSEARQSSSNHLYH